MIERYTCLICGDVITSEESGDPQGDMFMHLIGHDVVDMEDDLGTTTEAPSRR